MIILSWNCRGLGHTRAVPNFRELVRTHMPTLVFLSETLVLSNKVEEIRIYLGFDGAFSVNCDGRSGGLAVLWRYRDMCSILNYSQNHIDMKLSESSYADWRLTGFYGFPETTRRRQSWSLIRNLAATSTLPWCMIGDFNDILSHAEKRGHIAHPEWMIRGFREAINKSNLHDLPIQGHPFTWERHRGHINSVEEQLDRALATAHWKSRFAQATLTNLLASHSDHSPILLDTEPGGVQTAAWKFRFENRWLKEQELTDIVTGHWIYSGNQDMTGKLHHLSTHLSSWIRRLNQDLKDRIASTKNMLESLRDKEDPTSLSRTQELRDTLSNLLAQHEAYWKQRAKQF
ncbi:uncharacterized protein [Primulina huaijiensis]|uniref:uncharacterized protein n=1 Tax=Primulina huaijiensis TaxID=1492673 RepID=UPI003CC73AC3